LTSQSPSRWAVLAAFAAIYLLWGSTYIAIRFAVADIPPFLMSGSRFVIGGLVLMLWARAHGAALPSRRNVMAAAITAVMMFVLNNGALVWAAQYVPSGTLALFVGATPMWMVLLDWWRPTMHGRQAGGVRPTMPIFAGLLLGFTGIVLLADPANMASHGPQYVAGVVAMLVGTVGWAAGSIYSRQAQASLPDSPIMCSGLQLLTGGLMLMALAGGTGEFAQFQLSDITLRAGISWAWLTLAGSIIGFGSYIWLLRVSTPARVGTYAYVNPIVAVLIGWAIGGEPLTERTILAAAVIIGAVMLINNSRNAKPKPRIVARASESAA
jgi:drug/metabolite transporter (DMT)-like permease